VENPWGFQKKRNKNPTSDRGKEGGGRTGARNRVKKMKGEKLGLAA